jgi:tetratricopeptide (TPR) repeat protein
MSKPFDRGPAGPQAQGGEVNLPVLVASAAVVVVTIVGAAVFLTAGDGASDAPAASGASTQAATPGKLPSEADKTQAQTLLTSAVAKMAVGELPQASADLTEALRLDPTQSVAHYNLGIVYLRQKRTDDALKAFEAAFKSGFKHFDAMDQDPDLAALRKDSRFKALLARYRPPQV